MTTEEMILKISAKYGQPVIRHEGSKIVVHPFKFLHEGSFYTIYENVERIGLVLIIRTPDENTACERFLGELERLGRMTKGKK